MYQVIKDTELYTFIAIDACLEPGPRRPFNFVGMLTFEELKNINSFIKIIENTHSNYTIWFGHFPTSCILSQGEHVRSLIGKLDQGLVYLCGHLHTLGGIVPSMYTLQREGFLELELGDWKDNRMYRLMAIDHGLISFVDVHHNEWPVVLVTNPKHALFIIPGKENLETIKHSSHIRILAFSISPIVEVNVRVDDGNWIKCDNVEGPLYVAKWIPVVYQSGLHTINVSINNN